MGGIATLDAQVQNKDRSAEVCGDGTRLIRGEPGMKKNIWTLHCFQSGRETFFIIAVNYDLGLVEAFKIALYGPWEQIGGNEPLPDPRLFYAVRPQAVPPDVRARLRHYLDSPEFQSMVDGYDRLDITGICQPAGRESRGWNQ